MNLASHLTFSHLMPNNSHQVTLSPTIPLHKSCLFRGRILVCISTGFLYVWTFSKDNCSSSHSGSNGTLSQCAWFLNEILGFSPSEWHSDYHNVTHSCPALFLSLLGIATSTTSLYKLLLQLCTLLLL